MARPPPQRHPVVLSPHQERVARIVTSLRAAEGFALAGGAALVIAEVVDRQAQDLDFFGATAERVYQLVPVLERALQAEGLEVSSTCANSGFAHLTVTDYQGAVTEIDLGVDARIAGPRCTWTGWSGMCPEDRRDGEGPWCAARRSC